MAVQASNVVWTALRDEIRTWMSQNGYGTAAYLSERPTDETISQYAVQIIPGGDAAKHPISGVGLLEAQVTIVVWWRSLLDDTNRASFRIGGQNGIEAFIDDVRNLLIQNDLTGRLTIPLTWRSGGTIEPADDLVGWMKGTETFMCAYEIDWVVP